MFSKKTIAGAGAIILIASIVIVFSFRYIRTSSVGGLAVRAALTVMSPIQAAITSTVGYVDDLWSHYFFLVHAARENETLKMQLALAESRNNECTETILANQRLRNYVQLKDQSPFTLLAAEVIARDPSPWFKTIIINKGTDDGVAQGCPAIVSEGIAGYVLEATGGYAKVLLIVDQNSSVDALVQKTRARGIAQGMGNGSCRLDYALRQIDVAIGDTVVTSGFDGIYPKGLRIGYVSKVVRRNSGLFQDIEMTPYVDFKKLEEVMIILNPPTHDFESE
ncbi:MAG: rod shape-determining protein MreC [Desulfobacteraceae bacterium]|nr:MAG: rod shape-determining protein MreC [Desulfobacteraceae bacterium]